MASRSEAKRSEAKRSGDMSKPHGNKESWLAALDAEGTAFREAAAGADLATQVPTCPEWTLGELVHHLGEVYIRVTRYATSGSTVRPEGRPRAEIPAGVAPLRWWDEQFAEAKRALAAVAPDAPAWNWAPQAKQAVFWHRRVALETVVHRWDAQVTSGLTEPIEAKLAADGVTEVIDSWLQGGRRLGRTDGVRGIVALHATDLDQAWYVRLREENVALLDTDTLLDDVPPHERAQATGTTSDLMLALYGRVPFDVLEVAGDPRLLEALRAG
jgi:uncharacterized protein (TIGR03083 family)